MVEDPSVISLPAEDTEGIIVELAERIG